MSYSPLLSSLSGLVADLDLELGNFFLSEMLVDRTFHHLYRARISAPTDSQVAMKLAYVCRKKNLFRLGRILCKSLLSFLPEDHPDYQRAVRILHDIKNKQEKTAEEAEG